MNSLQYMKKWLFILPLFAAFFAGAQDSWKITHNAATRLTAAEEAPEENVFSIRIADLNKPGQFSLTYKTKLPAKDWVRTISIVDEDDTELASFKGRSFTLQNPALRALFKKAQFIKIYTMAIPSDPEKAALVRVRRVHLATVSLTR